MATETDGTATTHLIHNDQQRAAVRPDGTLFEHTSGEDPRWGMTAAVVSSTATLPSGLRREQKTYRSASLASAADPTSATLVRERTVINGETWETTYDLVARTRTTISPAGRVHRVTSDAQGRPILIEQPGRSAIHMAYDSRGRLEATTSSEGESARTTRYAYSSESGYLESLEDGSGQTSTYERDALGRVTRWTRPDGHEVTLSYDPNGNVIAITPPEKPTHAMSYTATEQLAEYIPPALAQSSDSSTIYEYTADGKLERVLFPDGRIIDNTYRPDGKLASVTTPRGTTIYSYNPVTGGLRSILDPDGAKLTFGSDGHLPNAVVWNGPDGHVRGWVGRTYDASFRVASLSVNGATVATFTRDPDGRIANAGAMEIARDPASGDLVGTTLGAVTTSEQVSPQGELQSYEASYQNEELYSEEILARDGLGRITLRRETVQGTSTEYAYEYDAAGRLSEVFVNGTLVRHYNYDANGNRLARVTQDETETCAYDAQDRLTSCGSMSFEYNATGQLTKRIEASSGASTSFDYDVFGNLRTATLPDGRVVTYDIDPHNRRIGKRIDGVRQWGLLYQTQLAPIAQLDPQNRVVSTFIYTTKRHVPDYMVKAGETYRIVTDHLGSVRMVVSTISGEVAQRIDYDEFGKVQLDTNAGFQPFGFAGGLYDADTGLVRFGARDYEPNVGRWTAKDPILFEAGQENLYVYVNGDPVLTFQAKNRSDRDRQVA